METTGTNERRDLLTRLRGAGRRTLLVAAAILGMVVFGLAFWVGWATDDTEAAIARAEPLAAKPTSVEVMRLARVPALPELRPARRPRPERPAAARRSGTVRRTPPPPPRRQAAPRPTPPPVRINGAG